MPRPPKYDTAKDAAENNLYSKMRGAQMGLSLEEFIYLATSKCHVCGDIPSIALMVDRKDSKYVLHWNYVVNGEPTCSMCKALAKDYGIKVILRHAARIMAKRMHDKKRNMFLRSQDKPLTGRSSETDTT